MRAALVNVHAVCPVLRAEDDAPRVLGEIERAHVRVHGDVDVAGTVVGVFVIAHCCFLMVGAYEVRLRLSRTLAWMVVERLYIGSVMGSMEGWLGVRSLRTFELRVTRQSENAGNIVAFLDGCVAGSETGADAAAVKKVIANLEHASLQKEDAAWLKMQMPNGFGPVFCLKTRSAAQAKRLPSKLALFHHATSLGGVESLIEWRQMSDPTVEDTVCRVSVGVEAWEDLKRDIVDGCKALVEEDERPQEPEKAYKQEIAYKH